MYAHNIRYDDFAIDILRLSDAIDKSTNNQYTVSFWEALLCCSWDDFCRRIEKCSVVQEVLT